MRSLRRLWTVHIRDFAFENTGLEHNPGLEAGELMRSWYANERRDFLSWVSRRSPPPLARAASLAMAAKGIAETFAGAFAPAETALARLDALLPSSDPVATLSAWVERLRTDEVAFLEGGTEIHELHAMTFDRPAPKGAAWAASLALAMRPQLFGFGAAPFALAGLAPRTAFRPAPEEPLPVILRAALAVATSDLNTDLDAARRGLALADRALSGLYASSRAPDAWHLLLGLGPLTRAELARALGVTKRTASQSALALIDASLVTLRETDSVLMAP
jgi:DNA-binding transcriptional ArsR family regulator